MKILYIITKLELGGAQKICLKLAEAFSKEHDVHVMAGAGGLLNDEAKKMLGDRFVINPYMGREISPFDDVRALKFIRSYIQEHSVDIVHTHSSKAGILGRYAAYKEKVQKVFHTIHGFAFNDYRNTLVNEIYKATERWAARFATKLVAVTAEDIAIGLKCNIGKKDQYALIRAAADIDHFTEFSCDIAEVKRSLSIPVAAKVVTQIACFKKQKNPVDFIKLAQVLISGRKKDIYFILIGDGVLRKPVEDAISRFGVAENIRLLGWQADVRPYLAASDVITLTSLWEGLPITIVEAFAMRKPVVVTAVNGNKEIVKDGKNGYLYTPGDIPAAARRITDLIEDERLKVQLGESGFNDVAVEFSYGEMIKKTAKMYETV